MCFCFGTSLACRRGIRHCVVVTPWALAFTGFFPKFQSLMNRNVLGGVDKLAGASEPVIVVGMTCSRCENLDEHVRFRTRGELFRAIGTIRQAVSDGDIEEIDAGPMKGTLAFSDLSEATPLDDLLLYRFRCPECGQNFVLGAETYHGSSGSWSKSAPLKSA
jgi:hypothetical protein